MQQESAPNGKNVCELENTDLQLFCFCDLKQSSVIYFLQGLRGRLSGGLEAK